MLKQKGIRSIENENPSRLLQDALGNLGKSLAKLSER